jgi:hypothetical protein
MCSSDITYTRLGNVYQEYLAALMKPFSFEGDAESMPWGVAKFSARPRIINGRFFHSTKWVLHDRNAKPVLPGQRFCPHSHLINTGFYFERHLRTILRNAKRPACDAPIFQWRGSCDRCPTVSSQREAVLCQVGLTLVYW